MSGGFFLAVEGPEGAGKSTLVAGLATRFRAVGQDPILVREPGGTPVAERVRGVLLDPTYPIEPVAELLLFLAARAELVTGVIRPALASGRVVLADRFELSTEAYQGGGRGIDSALLRSINRAATGGLTPDLTLVLDLPVEIGFRRIQGAGQGMDRIEQAGAEFHGRVAGVFRDATGPGVVHLDATQPPDRVLQAAWLEAEAGWGGARPARRG
jgi:dTMP kinase